MIKEITTKEENYAELKSDIRANIEKATEAFFQIGYCLRQIAEGELYREDGYRNIYEFAETEYKISQSTATRFMKINAEFSLDGGVTMETRYIGMGASKLQEMLGLSKKEREQVTLDTTVKEIRELKKAKKSGKGKATKQIITTKPTAKKERKKRPVTLPAYTIDEVASAREAFAFEVATLEQMGADADRIKKSKMMLEAMKLLERRVTAQTAKAAG